MAPKPYSHLSSPVNVGGRQPRDRKLSPERIREKALLTVLARFNSYLEKPIARNDIDLAYREEGPPPEAGMDGRTVFVSAGPYICQKIFQISHEVCRHHA